MHTVIKYDDELTQRIASTIRLGDPDNELIKALYEGKPTYGADSGLQNKERILELLIQRNVRLDGRLAHAYEHGFYLPTDILTAITRHKAYRMGANEAELRLGTLSYGDPR